MPMLPASLSMRSAPTPLTCAARAKSRVPRPSSRVLEAEYAMPFHTIDGISTRYELLGAGPPLLMFSPGGFNATLDTWSSLGAYARTKPLEHLSRSYTCIIFDRRETGQSGGRVECISWAHYVAQGKGLLDHPEIKRAHLMGGCMGCS